MAYDLGLAYYFAQLSKLPLLTAEEEKKVTRLARKGDKKAIERLVSGNLRLVVKIAHQFSNHGLPLADLIEEGNLGLLYAVNKFDPRKGNRFSTYARWWIMNFVRRAVRNVLNPIKLPVTLIDMISKYKKASVRLSHKLGREPYYDEIIKELDPSPQFMRIFRRALRFEYAEKRDLYPNIISGEIDIFLTDKPGPIQDQPMDNTDKKLIRKFMSQIEPQEAKILNLRYGLTPGKKELNLRQIAKKLKISPEGVRYIEQRALKKLHDAYWQAPSEETISRK